MPHVGCQCPNCGSAARDPALRRSGPSVALVDDTGTRAWLIDASPDLPAQLRALGDLLLRGGDADRDAPPSIAPVEALLLTHAHVGHYWGLGHLGKEGLNARGLPVHCTARMAAFLGSSRPFSDLVGGGALRLVVAVPSEPVRLAPGLVAVPEPVTHRDDGSDTVAWAIETSRRRALYMPDVDALDHRAESLVATADLALVDGTFYSAGELPPDGREVPHPPVRESLARLASAAAEGTRVVFTHINHTNPLCDPGSAESAAVRRAGMEVSRDGMAFEL